MATMTGKLHLMGSPRTFEHDDMSMTTQRVLIVGDGERQLVTAWNGIARNVRLLHERTVTVTTGSGRKGPYLIDAYADADATYDTVVFLSGDDIDEVKV